MSAEYWKMFNHGGKYSRGSGGCALAPDAEGHIHYWTTFIAIFWVKKFGLKILHLQIFTAGNNVFCLVNRAHALLLSN